jgi:hypothetical protein
MILQKAKEFLKQLKDFNMVAKVDQVFKKDNENKKEGKK